MTRVQSHTSILHGSSLLRDKPVADEPVSDKPVSTAVHQKWWQFAALASVLSISACSGLGNLQPAPSEPWLAPLTTTELAPISDKTMISDLLDIAVQVFSPLSTTLQFNTNENDPMMQYFISEFSALGYGIQRVSADQGSHHFTYSRTDIATDTNQPSVRFTTTIGAVDFSRDYQVSSDNIVTPVSEVRLSGTRVPVTVNDVQSARMSAPDPDISQAVYVASLNLEEQVPPVISLITNELVDRVAEQSALTLQARSSEKASVNALNSNRVEITNLLYTGGSSNFASLLEDYDTVERASIIFANDSLVLGDTNKRLIEKMLIEHLQAEDLVSLVGCSTGPTALEIGNEGLALGRAERITQELLSQGIPRERILDEGCWAPVAAGDDLPARGVVMEIWRRQS